MYSNKKNHNNDGEPSPDSCRLRSRPRFQFFPVFIIILVTVCCLLIIKPCDAAAVNASMDNRASLNYQIEQVSSEEVLLTVLEKAYLSQADLTEASPAQAATASDHTAQDIIPQDSAAQASTALDNTALTGTEQEQTATELSPEDENPFVYNSNIPLDSDIQEYLYDLCVERNLDYKMCLAIIRHESNFNAKALGGGSNYGLFQINKCNHKKLSTTLKTENKPFDPKTNIDWGTYLLSCLFEKYSSSYTDEDLLKAVLSAYNRGEGGFAKYGFAKSYIKEYDKAFEEVNSWF